MSLPPILNRALNAAYEGANEIIQFSKRIDNLKIIIFLLFVPNLVVGQSFVPNAPELNLKSYKSFISRIKNAGSICLGKYAVMAMTDYNAGSNHILPTNGSAKFSSGISVNEFYKRISYINLSKKGIEKLGPSVITLANYEGLAGHAQSVKKRIRRK